MHSGSLILKKDCDAHAQTFHEANFVVFPCKRAQHYCAMLRRSQNNRNDWTCCVKSLTGLTLYTTSVNIAVAPCKRTQHVMSNNVACRLAKNVASVCMGLN